MKQHITKKQWLELSAIKREDWCNFIDESEQGRDYSSEGITFPNIGQMIEFLSDEIKSLEFEVDMWFLNNDYEGIKNNEKELADCLWGAVKQVLEEEI